jgi:uncharacterized protein
VTPHVANLRLYPIKGLDGVAVSQSSVLPSGALAYDRRWALSDTRGRFVNGKNTPAIHAIRATFDLERLEVALDGKAFSLAHEGPAIAARFSEVLATSLTYREDPDVGFPDDLDSPGPTLITTPTLETVAAWFDLDLENTRRRFRTNVEISGDGL